VKTTVKGNIDPEARAFCFNHQSPIDIVAMMNVFQLSYVSMASVQKLFFVKIAESYSDFVFVDRTKTQGVSQVLASAIDNDNIFPVMVSPEGAISNGNAILKFRTGAFLTERKIQPVCLRYHHYFCRRSIGAVNWLQESIYEFLFQFLSIPFVTIEITCLDAMDWTGRKLTPSEKAIETQLKMANFLGIPAIDRSNKERFQKKVE
jgi:1-acyl-sn-glycerol-3-phosphate acyltransferase